MKIIHLFLIVLLCSLVVVGAIYHVTQQARQEENLPERIPTYEEVVPQRFSALDAPRVLSMEDAGALLEPRLGIVRVGDAIVEEACPLEHPKCVMLSLHRWVQQEIAYTNVLPSRDYVISPEETILYREMDDHTGPVLLAALLRSQGLRARVGIDRYSAFVETRIEGEDVRLDPGCGACQPGTIRYRGDNESLSWIS